MVQAGSEGWYLGGEATRIKDLERTWEIEGQGQNQGQTWHDCPEGRQGAGSLFQSVGSTQVLRLVVGGITLQERTEYSQGLTGGTVILRLLNYGYGHGYKDITRHQSLILLTRNWIWVWGKSEKTSAFSLNSHI